MIKNGYGWCYRELSDPVWSTGFVNWALVVIVCVIQNFFFTLAHAIKEDYLETCLLEDYH